MERHKLWNDRAEKLMRQTFESWSKGKKKKVYEDEEWGYDEEGNSLNPDDKKELDESPRYGEEYADMDGEGNDNPSQDVYAMLDALRMHVAKVDMDEDTREYISDELLMIMDKMDANPEMTDTKYPEPPMAEKLSEMSDETENPDVARAAEDAKQAKIKAVKAQLDALQK